MPLDNGPIFPSQPDGRVGKRTPPFSIRLTEAERERLIGASGGIPLGTYIKAKALDDAAPLRLRRSGLPVEDHKALAQVIALLGRSRVPGNLNQLAHAANIGTLPVTPETMDELHECLRFVREVRALLLRALGLRAEDAP